MKAGLILALLAAVAVAIWIFVASAPDNRHILISDAVAQPLGDGGGAVVILTIENSGGPDILLSASSAGAEVELYQPLGTDGLPIQSGTSSLALDGAHVIVTNPGSSLADGSLIPLTLQFARAGEVTARARLSDPVAAGNASTAGLFGLGGICQVGEGEPAPKISLEVEPDGEGWAVRVVSEEFEFSEDLIDLYHVPGMGHGHLYVGGMKLGRMLKPEAHIGALPEGTHEVRVTLNTNDHRAYVVGDEPITASVQIVVD